MERLAVELVVLWEWMKGSLSAEQMDSIWVVLKVSSLVAMTEITMVSKWGKM